jgi:hypothetical protein
VIVRDEDGHRARRVRNDVVDDGPRPIQFHRAIVILLHQQ